MQDSKKTKKQLLEELAALRTRLTLLEKEQKSKGSQRDYFSEKIIFLESFIDEISEPVLVIGTDFKVKYANRAAYNLSGIKNISRKDEVYCYKLLFDSDSPCDKNGQKCLLKMVSENGKDVTMDHSTISENGEEKIYEILGSPIWGEEKKLLGIVYTIRDVTQHRADKQLLETGHDFLEIRVQERTSDLIDLNNALRQEIAERQKTEERLRWALEQAELLYKVSPCAIFTVNTDRDITSWNNKIEEISGYSYKEILGRKCKILCSEPTCGLFSENVQKPIINHECTMRTKDGRILTIAKSADLLHDPKGNIIGGIESFEDITKRKEMDKALRSERDKFQGMIAATRQGLHILNSDYEIEFQNDVLKNIFGDQIGHKCYEVYKKRSEPCEVCRMHSVFQKNQIEHAEDIIFNERHYSQSYAPFKDVDGQTKCLVLLRDITVEKVNRAKTMRTAQLASIGELAAGVAHEINNPINGIINFAQLLLEDIDKGTSKALLNRLLNEGERVADIVSKLLDFARQREDDQGFFDDVNLSEVVDNSFSLFKHQFHNHGITTRITVPPDIPPLQVNPHQLQQVFVNLLSNASHALNERYPGKDPNKILEIDASMLEQENKEYVRITFKDHGGGIPEDIVDMIFTPFFSTKQQGEGTGLGLSISQGLIKSFHGQMHLESKPDEYTSMIIELPVKQENMKP
ncbi:MAG: PAS domain-containing protein [Desulfobulbaceae bacterium]|nr:PAS domain-containing protein [Desulfobulbaceae bacterium]